MRTRLPDQEPENESLRHKRINGFTLLELLVTLTILVTAMTVIIGTFSVTLRGWNRSQDLLKDLHHGDFVMEQLVSALRSTAFIHHTPEKYGFWLDDNGGRYPSDKISWVTSGTAFMLPNSPLANGLHRLEIAIENNEDGEPAVAARAYPHLADIDDVESETWFVSSVVQGIECRTYDEDAEDWDDDWEDTNAVPSLVAITLYMEPLEEFGEPVKISRVVEIPVASVVANAVRFQEEDREENEAGEVPNAEDEGAASGGESGPGNLQDDGIDNIRQNDEEGLSGELPNEPRNRLGLPVQ